MFGIVSKQDKKVLQKIRENKDKDEETWKFIIGRETGTIITTGLLFPLAECAMNDAAMNSTFLRTKILGVIALIYYMLNVIGIATIIVTLTIGDKKEDKKESEK